MHLDERHGICVYRSTYYGTINSHSNARNFEPVENEVSLKTAMGYQDCHPIFHSLDR